jgi:hypothetical protein
MLRIDRKNQGFTLLETPSLAEVSISERYDLQEFISNSPDAFFQELGLELFLVGKENSPQRREVRQVEERGKKLLVRSNLFWINQSSGLFDLPPPPLIGGLRQQPRLADAHRQRCVALRAKSKQP